MEKSASVSNEAPAKVCVKKEIFNDEIKEFAETAMNELLGWYGYNNHQRDDRHSYRPNSGSNSSNPESPKSNECCGWCGKIVDETTALSSATAVFCSELCFSQSRRANFKKNKTCDWCRHVRHTVTYVDSQDGSTQLQFCSDKCLNQYKMHIFWRETRAHLEIHPHLPSGGGGGGDESSSSGTLITPELWMNKCKSPEIQHESALAGSPNLERNKQDSPLPLITVTPVSKLMSIPETVDLKQPQSKRTKLQKRNKRKATPMIESDKFCNEMPQDLRVRHTTPPMMTTTPSATTTTTTTTSSSPTIINGLTSDENLPNTSNPRLLPVNLSNTNNDSVSGGSGYRKFLANCLPPPTILLPYPIVLPLPVPIPLPIPLPVPNSLFESFVKTKVEVSSQTEDDDIDSQKLLNSSQNTKKIVSPLRKRKKVVEKKAKINVKNRKTNSFQDF